MSVWLISCSYSFFRSYSLILVTNVHIEVMMWSNHCDFSLYNLLTTDTYVSCKLCLMWRVCYIPTECGWWLCVMYVPYRWMGFLRYSCTEMERKLLNILDLVVWMICLSLLWNISHMMSYEHALEYFLWRDSCFVSSVHAQLCMCPFHIWTGNN